MSLKERTYAGIGEWLRRQGFDVVEVLRVKEVCNDYTAGIMTYIDYMNHHKEEKSVWHYGPVIEIVDDMG